MESYDNNFLKLFKEMESGHIQLREKLNAFSEKGDDLEKRLSEELRTYELWRFEVMDGLAEIVTSFTNAQKEKHKRFIQGTQYYHIVQEAPFYWRIMNKPNGYAGDAHMMSFIYRNQFEGKTPFGMFLHKHAVSTKACQAVRNRKLYLTQKIIRANGGKILSLAAGPAQEIKELLDVYKNDQYWFMALDHDMDTLKTFDISDRDSRFRYALANAFQIISGNYITARPRKIFERFCQPRIDFQGLRSLASPIKYEMGRLKKEDFDLVYSAGLFDYIKTFPLDDSKGAIALTNNLFDLVKPEGSLIIGNFSHKNPRDLKFVMEYILDWKLIYRDRKDMLDFARSIPESAIENIQVVEESQGINYFLTLVKRPFQEVLLPQSKLPDSPGQFPSLFQS
jgi:hypothetical protein